MGTLLKKFNSLSAVALLATSCSAAFADTPAQARLIEWPEGWLNKFTLFGDNALGSGSNILVDGVETGAAYYFKGWDTKSGTITNDLKLIASDGAAGDWFGTSNSLWGNNALIGAPNKKDSRGRLFTGAAYYFKDLDSKSGTVTEDIKLTPSNPIGNPHFGSFTTLWEDNALVGGHGLRVDGIEYVGAAYYFKGLNGKSGTVTEDVRLLASGDATNISFGGSGALSGDNALIGMRSLSTSQYARAYYFRGLDSKSGDVTEDFQLLTSDGATANDLFGEAIALWGDKALVGARNAMTNGAVQSGSAYYYKNLDTKSEDTIEDVKLIASNPTYVALFGESLYLYGDSAMIRADARSNPRHAGMIYYYKDLDSKSGTVTEDIKFTSSEKGSTTGIQLVTMNGNHFTIRHRNISQNYMNDIRAFTTLDVGNTSLSTGGLSFESHGDWIIGATTSGNHLTIDRNFIGTDARDVATITDADKAVYIGQYADANNNSLLIKGELKAHTIYVGAEGNKGNMLLLAADSAVPTDATINLAENNGIGFESDTELDFVDLVQSFADANSTLLVSGIEVDANNASTLLTKWYDSAKGFTYFGNGMIPEPATYAAIFGAVVLGFAAARRRFKAAKV